jgi:hypothetical protein
MSDNSPIPGKPFTFVLARPIQAHGNECRSLTFREVKGSDIRRLGIPFRIEPGGLVAMNDARMMDWIAELAQIPAPSVDQIHASDLLMLQNYLPLFFAPPAPMTEAPGASSTQPSSSPSIAAPHGGGAIPASLS